MAVQLTDDIRKVRSLRELTSHQWETMTAVHPNEKNERLTLRRFSIGAFRGLRNVDLDGLGRVNLLVGSGNSGKTSILEALAIFANPMSLQHWSGVVRTREFRNGIFYDPNSTLESLVWLFPHHADSLDGTAEYLPISLRGWGEAPIRGLEASITPIRGTTVQTRFVETEDGQEEPVEEQVEDEGFLFQLTSQLERDELPLEGSQQEIRSEFPYWRNAGIHRVNSRTTHRMACEFLAPYSHRNQPGQLRGMTKAVIENEKASVAGLIRQLDPDVLGIEIISDAEGRRPLIALRHRRAGLTPLAVFGDGLRRALTISLAIQQARNGLLLVDEIEAALHVSALDKVFPWLIRACQHFNVQLVATTHSLEAVDAISQSVPREDTTSLTAFHLGKPSEEGGAKRYSSSMLRRLVHERGLDIR